ncbi:MAG: hypothetical protein AB1798_15085 [Spirochaetota bacterium]
MRRVRGVILLVLLILAGSLYSQEISARKEIAVFALSYYDWKIPGGALGMVDEQIKGVFIKLNRFNVIGMNYRLGSRDINDFIARIREIKEAEVEIPESVRLGQEAFTESDFNKLVGSFIVVVPVMSYYNLTRDQKGNYGAEMETAFTFIDVQNYKTMAQFAVKTTGYNDTPNAAVKDAADDIFYQLTFEIRKIPEFQLKTGIIDVKGSTIFIEFGSNMGVKKGDEYAVVVPRLLPSGHAVTDEVGLLVIKEVKEEISVGKLIYSKQKPMIGDQIQEVPRLGFDTSLYVHGTFNFANFADTVILAGLRQSISRGLYGFRPLIGVEVPINLRPSSIGFPLNLYLGGELNWYLGRFQIVPMAAGGLGGAFGATKVDKSGSAQENFYLTHGGFITQVTLNYLAGRSVRLLVEGGYTFWFSFSVSSWGDYGGFFAGLGVLIKY